MDLEANKTLLDNDSPDNDNSCIIHVENYDGPLDLLWSLIKKSKIDITEISISHVTEQYIAFLKLMESLNVRLASEFIWMASELLYYKSRALLPVDGIEDEYFTPALPPELVAKLLEYKKYQMGSERLKGLFELQAECFMRQNSAVELGDSEEYLDVSLFDLLRAFAGVLESRQDIEREEIIFDEILVSDRINYITDLLKDREYILFYEIFSEKPSKGEVISSFLAILEMTKTGMVLLYQHRNFGDIRIARCFSVEEVS